MYLLLLLAVAATSKNPIFSSFAVDSPMSSFTHFISLPLGIHPQLVNKLNEFKSSILTSNEYKGFRIDESIFAIPESLHLTVLMLELQGENIAKASSVLKSVSDKLMEALKNRPISIQLRGLACMKGSPDKAWVVYAPVLEVGEQGRLQQVCDIIIDAFTSSNLAPISDEKRELKLHATVMNARFRKSYCPDASFDARKIFEKYEEHEWGKYLIPEIHLCQTRRFDESGRYYCCSSIPLTGNMQAERASE